MGQTILASIDLTTESCGKCGGVFAINEDFRKRCQQKGGSWVCPYCSTSWSYTKSEVQRLKEELDNRTKALIAAGAAHDQTKAKLKDTEKQLIAEKESLSNANRRSANGVCPCCGRTFKQIVRHMATKHPDYVAKLNEKKTKR